MAKDAQAQILETKRFVIRKKLVGQNAIVRFTNKEGKTFEYEHDKVFEANKEKLEAMPCFQKYSTYTATNSIPKFAKEFTAEVS